MIIGMEIVSYTEIQSFRTFMILALVVSVTSAQVLLDPFLIHFTVGCNVFNWSTRVILDPSFLICSGSVSEFRPFFFHLYENMWNFNRIRNALCTVDPAGTQHQNDVVSTSMRRDHVVSTLIKRHFNVVCPLGMCRFRFTKQIFCTCAVSKANWNVPFLNNLFIFNMNTKTKHHVALPIDLRKFSSILRY